MCTSGFWLNLTYTVVEDWFVIVDDQQLWMTLKRLDLSRPIVVAIYEIIIYSFVNHWLFVITQQIHHFNKPTKSMRTYHLIYQSERASQSRISFTISFSKMNVLANYGLVLPYHFIEQSEHTCQLWLGLTISFSRVQ